MLVGQARRNGWPAAERNKKGSAGFAKIHYKVKRPMLALPRLTAGSKDQSSIGGANNATGKSSQAITSFHFFDFFNISNFYHLNFYQQITCIIRFYRKEGRPVREAVIIIPPTLEAILAEKMKISKEEMREANIRHNLHNGATERPILSQWKMNAIQFFKSAQRGKANEGPEKAALSLNHARS